MTTRNKKRSFPVMVRDHMLAANIARAGTPELPKSSNHGLVLF